MKIFSLQNNGKLCERGVSAVELALVAPILLFFLLLIVEVGRYLTLRGILNTTADQAVAIAATSPKIARWEPAVGAPQSDTYYQGVDEVVEKVLGDKSLARTTFFSDGRNMSPGSMAPDQAYIKAVRLLPPQQSSPGETAEQAFENRPIRIEIDAEIKPLIPCLGALLGFAGGGSFCPTVYRSTIVATAFKEPTRALTMPVLTDCAGRPAGDPDYYKNCPCDPEKYWDRGQKKCVCYTGDTNSDGICDCPAGYQFSMVSKECTCNVEELNGTCGVGKIADAATCSCVCNTGNGFTNVGGECLCVGSKSVVDGKCQCTAQCNTGQIQNTEDCSCGCPDAVFASAKNACSIYGGTWDSTSCSCNCGAGKKWIKPGWGGYCSCTNPDQTMDSGSAGYPCRCNTWGGLEDDGAGGCKCKNSLKQSVEGQCECPNLADPCPNPNQQIDPNTCSCGCLEAKNP